MLEMKGNQTNQKKVSNNSDEENVSPVTQKNQMNGIQNNVKSSENDVEDGTLDCASLPQSYYNEWKRLFLRSDYLRNLKNLSMQGSLRSSRFRSVCWKIFMGVLPEEISHWTEKTRESRSIYHDLKMQMIVNPRKAEPKDLSINNPLSQVIESPWNQFFIDNALRLTIKQDVIRTCGHRFVLDIDPFEERNMREKFKKICHPKIEFFHTDDIRTNMVDILFVYAKLRPNISYRQGMHELLAPLIFVLHCDQQAFLHACETDTISFFPNMERNLIKEILNPEYLEHDAFSIFCKMMETIEPWYVSKEMPPVVMTNSMVTTPFARPQELIPSNVIVTKLTRVQDYLLKRFDPQLFEHLQKLDIAPQVYGIRWVRLLFGREFPFQDLLILWDAIFADGIGFDLVDYVFVAMLMYLRGSLLCSDYSSCLTPLMKFPPVPDIHYFINKALYLRDPKNRPPIADQFYCKPSQNQLASEGSRRNGDSVTLSTRFSRLVRGKRPGSLFISSGLMSKSTSEPMNLITDSALSPVKENLQFTPSRKGSSASLPPPDLSTPLLSSNIHNNFSCQSLHRLDTSTRSEPTDRALDNQGSPHNSAKFFVFGARGGRKNLTNKVKQMKSTSEQEILKALSSYSEMETICRRCAMELDGYIGTLQRHLFKKDAPNISADDEVFLALAGIKQIRDILKGAVKPTYLYDSPEHMQHSMHSDGSAFSSLRRKQQPVSAQSSLSGTPMCDRPLGKFFLATPDFNPCELESPELDARFDLSVQNRGKMVKTPSKPNLPSEVELGEVKNGSRDEKDDDPKTPINLNFKTSDSMMFGFNENAGDLIESGPHSMLHFRASPSRSPQQRQGRSKEGESTGVVRRREGSPMDRIADMFQVLESFDLKPHFVVDSATSANLSFLSI